MGNPFYLHEDDHSGLVLVLEPLDESNYLFWSRSMERALDIKDKLGFINGEVAEPKAGEANYERWGRVNATVMCWIFNSMSKEIARNFVFAKNAKALWDGVYEIYGVAANAVRNLQIYQLKRELCSLTQGTDSVTDYYCKLQRLWDELTFLRSVDMKPCNCRCGCHEAYKSRVEEDKLIQFLIGLSDDFDAMRNIILITEPLPSLRKAYSLVLLNEGRQKTVDNATAKLAKYRKCEFCGRKGHIKENCFKLHGYPRSVKQELGKNSDNVAASQKIDFARYGYYAGPTV